MFMSMSVPCPRGYANLSGRIFSGTEKMPADGPVALSLHVNSDEVYVDVHAEPVIMSTMLVYDLTSVVSDASLSDVMLV